MDSSVIATQEAQTKKVCNFSFSVLQLCSPYSFVCGKQVLLSASTSVTQRWAGAVPRSHLLILI